METKPARSGPVLTLIVLAPLICEVLPGATRTSALFVFPLEMAIWGGGALLIRAAVRYYKLGWLNMLLMAFALSIAEEFVIHQTSIAPMILQIFPGPPFGRVGDFNYVYFLWALFYESILVVMIPVIVTELIFPERRHDPWIGKSGAWITAVIFLVACIPATYLWVHVVREVVLKLPPYSSPRWIIATGVLAIIALVWLSIGPMRRRLMVANRPLAPWSPWSLGAAGFVAAFIWHALVVLAFGMRPAFPEWIAMTVGLGLAALGLYLLPRFAAHERWSDSHRIGLSFGTILGAMVVSFVGFIYATSALDLWGKIVMNVIATILLIVLAIRVRRGYTHHAP
jgi:hypothetical protein